MASPSSSQTSADSVAGTGAPAGDIALETRLALYRSCVELRRFESRAYDRFL